MLRAAVESWIFRPSRCDRGAGLGVWANGQLAGSAGGATERRQPGSADAKSPLQASFTSPPPTLSLAGEIDESTYQDLLDVLKLAAATRHHQLQVDLAGVVYCDLAGLRAIISLAPADSPGAASVDQLVIQHLPAQLSTVIRVLGWDMTPGLWLVDPGPRSVTAIRRETQPDRGY